MGTVLGSHTCSNNGHVHQVSHARVVVSQGCSKMRPASMSASSINEFGFQPGNTASLGLSIYPRFGCCRLVTARFEEQYIAKQQFDVTW